MVKVLIVDDSLFLRAALRLQLKALGCDVVGEAANLPEALERYRSLRPDLVTLDVVLDPGSGIEIAKKIYAMDPSAKILMVSAVGQKAITDEARKAGASGYITKPVEMSDLHKAIEQICGKQLPLLSRFYAGLSQEHLDRVLSRGLDMAATSLSKLVGKDVQVAINEFRLVPLREVARTLGDPEHVAIGVTFMLTGELEGRLSLLMERAGVLALVDLLLKRLMGTTKVLAEFEQSAVKETANILSNAYITALAQEIKLTLLPGPPQFIEASLGEILESLVVEESELAVADRFLLLRHSLTAPDLPLEGNLVMFLKDTQARLDK